MSGHVRVALREKYSAPAWALFEEVKNRTGHGVSERYADALAMSLYPSRGLVLYGFEIKVTRRDWLTERRNPDKAEAIGVYCDRWYVVIDDPKIVTDLDELPPTWGLIRLEAKKLVTLREAKERKPKALDRQFVAALLRRAAESQSAVMNSYVSRDVVNDRVKAEVEAHLEERVKRKTSEISADMHRQISALQNKAAWADEVARLSGMEVGASWQLQRIAPALEAFARLGRADVTSQLEQRAHEHEHAASTLRQAVKHLKGE